MVSRLVVACIMGHWSAHSLHAPCFEVIDPLRACLRLLSSVQRALSLIHLKWLVYMCCTGYGYGPVLNCTLWTSLHFGKYGDAALPASASTSPRASTLLSKAIRSTLIHAGLLALQAN